MQKFLKLFILTTFFLAGIFFFYPAERSVLSSGEKSSVAANKSARDLYVNNCARCHGADGKSNTKLGRSTKATDLTSRKVQKMSRKKMARIIKYGEDPMPSFGKKLTKKEINRIVSYVRSLD